MNFLRNYILKNIDGIHPSEFNGEFNGYKIFLGSMDTNESSTFEFSFLNESAWVEEHFFFSNDYWESMV